MTDAPNLPHLPTEPHPFARFVAILGRGKTKQRPLTEEEAFEAMSMILRGEALPEQIGAFLMLQRLKEEEPEEIAGFAKASRALMVRPETLPQVDLDWSSYAGKRIQLPWYLLAIMALVGSGMRIVMHGTEGHTAGRIYTRDVLAPLGLPVAGSFGEAAEQVETTGFAYLPLEVLHPMLRHLIELRPIFGLRSPVHSFTRLLNPFDAPCVLNGIFHRGFTEIHAGAAKLMNIPDFAVFRGDGGEVERRPNKPCQVWTTHGDSGPDIETWPAMLDEGHAPPDEDMDIARLLKVWNGKDNDAYALAAITGTMAIALKTSGRASDLNDAQRMAEDIWASRNKNALPTNA